MIKCTWIQWMSSLQHSLYTELCFGGFSVFLSSLWLKYWNLTFASSFYKPTNLLRKSRKWVNRENKYRPNSSVLYCQHCMRWNENKNSFCKESDRLNTCILHAACFVIKTASTVYLFSSHFFSSLSPCHSFLPHCLYFPS